MVHQLHSQGCSWDEGTCEAAPEFGNMVLMQWLLANGSDLAQEWFLEIISEGEVDDFDDEDFDSDDIGYLKSD